MDTTFNSTGKVTTTFGTTGDDAYAYAVQIQSDGKILIGGYAFLSGHYEFAVARYNTNGSLDSTFGSDGKTTLYDSATPLDDLGYAMALQDDGKIVVGGESNANFALGRFNADGSADTTFDSDGIVTADLGGTERINALITQSDGTIVAAGTSGSDFAIAKFHANGTLDTSFGASSGYTITNLSGTDAAYGLARQADGKFVAAGVTGAANFGVARFTADGILDTTFNTTGKISTDLGATDYAYAVAIGPDYKITVVGYSGNGSTTDNFAVARYKVTSGLEERLYAENDANHNVTSISDVFGSVKERFVYDPYGAATVLNASGSVISDSLSWIYRHQDLRYDSITNTLDNRERVYLISLGRFAQLDPSGYPDGVDRYQEELSNPLEYVDPSGLYPQKDLFLYDKKVHEIPGKRGTWMIRMVPDSTDMAVEVDVRYYPHEDSACHQIGLVQIVKLVDENTGKWLPMGRSAGRWLGHDNTETTLGWAVDRSYTNTLNQIVSANMSPFLNTTDAEDINKTTFPRSQFGDAGVKGGGVKYASMYDNPGNTIKNNTSLLFSFQTYAYSMDGAKEGTIYDGLSWSFRVAGVVKKDSFQQGNIASPTADFTAAAELWNRQPDTWKIKLPATKPY